MNQTQQPQLSDLLQVRREKLDQLRQAGMDPFVQTSYPVDTHAKEITDHYDQYEGKTVSLAGRMMSKRVMGKASFADLQDSSGRMQLFVGRDNLGTDAYQWFKKYDIGDIIGVKGEVFTTKTGQISVRVYEMTLLSKSLQPLPEKFHGLTNTDVRYRQRYVDLIMNPEVRDTFVKRSQIISAIRTYLAGEGFMEVETPILVNNARAAPPP